MADSFKVMRRFERHDGKALRKYARGQTISAAEAAKIPTMPRLINSGCVYRITDDLQPQAGKSKEVVADGQGA